MTTSLLLPEDIHYCMRFIPVDLRALIVANKLMIAGGFIRATIGREDVSDIDIFGPSITVLRDVAGRLADKYGCKAKETRNAITVAAVGRKPVQFITRWLYTDAEAVIQSFDFTIAQACIFPTDARDLARRASVDDPHGHDPIEGDNPDRLVWAGLCSDRFYADLAAKRLVYTEPARNEDAGGSLMRAVKFMGRGYRISPASLGKTMARLAQRVRWDSGMVSDEAGKAKVITGLLRQVDPLLAIDGVELADDEEVKVDDIKDALHPTQFASDESIPDQTGAA